MSRNFQTEWQQMIARQPMGRIDVRGEESFTPSTYVPGASSTPLPEPNLTITPSTSGLLAMAMRDASRHIAPGSAEGASGRTAGDR